MKEFKRKQKQTETHIKQRISIEINKFWTMKDFPENKPNLLKIPRRFLRASSILAPGTTRYKMGFSNTAETFFLPDYHPISANGNYDAGDRMVFAGKLR